MPAHNRKIKHSKLTLGGVDYEIQARVIRPVNESDDGDTFYTHGGDSGTFVEEADPNWTLELEFYSDWRPGGVSDFLQLNDNADVTCVVEHNVDIPGEHVTWTGTVHIKAPAAMGEARENDLTEVTLKWLGKPVYGRVA